MESIFYLPSTMVWPLLACLVLTGIHVYLGVHVIARKVIFVDLALAQIAALGTVIGVLLGYEISHDSNALYLYSLAFTIFGAFIFSVTRMKSEKVPHEAVIGIVYAVTFAATILILSKSALGPQELDHIIKGELLWVQGPIVIKTAIIYALVGLFHYIFRRKFMAISVDPEKAEADGMNVRLWDFLFYMSFGFVITSSVAIAGVFLVFSYLIIPAVGAMLFSDRLGTRLAIGWISGSIISFAGVKLSWDTGLPTSPLIVCVLALALIVGAMYRYVSQSPRKITAMRNLFASVAVVGIFIAGVLFFRKHQEDPLEHALHMLESPLSSQRQSALVILGDYTTEKDKWIEDVRRGMNDEDSEVRSASIRLLTRIADRASLSSFLKLLHDPSGRVKQSALTGVRSLGTKSHGLALMEVEKKEEDEELRINLLEAALELGCAEAVIPLLDLAEKRGVFSEDAVKALSPHLPENIGQLNAEQLRLWWKENETKLQWNPKTHRFEEGR